MKNHGAPPGLDTIREALGFISPNLPRDEWARVGMGLKAELGEAGFDLFDTWSQGGETYNARSTRDTWRSIKAGGAVTIGTLLHLAKQHGWQAEAHAPAPQPTPDELKARAAARQAAAAREKAERDKHQREAAAEAARLWAEASESGKAGYLQRKGVQAFGVRFGPDGTLLVPMRDAAGELRGVQTVKAARPADGGPDKLFLKGGRKTGLMHWCGTPDGAPVLLIAEGYATAASVHEATRRPVAVGFDCGNLPHVARALRGRYPAALIVIAGDDDRDTEASKGRNPGREKALEAAKLARGVAVFPEGLEGEQTDFNDLHQATGLHAVHEQIEAAIAAAQAAQTSKAAQTPPAAKKAVPAGRQRAARGTADDDAAGSAAGFDRYRCEDGALWFDPPGDDGGPGRPVRVCDALRVTAWARDVHGNGAALLLEFETVFGTAREWLMPLAMLAGDGTAYRAELLGQGFVAPTDAKRRGLLTQYLQTRNPRTLVRIVDRVGWHDAATGAGKVIALPRETLGDDGGERIMFQSDAPAESTFGKRGTLTDWQERIGRLCVGNSRLMFAASCAFAGPLLAWAAGTDGGGVHLVGDSSCGKTTALRVAASVNGGRDYLQRWRATDNGVEAMAAQHSDALLILDELAQLDPKAAGESAYLLANGAGKLRASRTGTARPRLTWRLLFLSAGEVGLSEHMSEANKRTRAGQELRMIDLPADAGAGLGIFETRHEFESGGLLAQHLARAAEATYGTPGRAWLEYLVDNIEGLAGRLRRSMDAIEAQFVPELASGQVQRVGRRFALIAAAGAMASEAGITGWPAAEPINAARRCFNSWIEARPGGIGMSEEEQMKRRARLWFQAHGQSARFPDWDRRDDDHAPQAINQAGWRRKVQAKDAAGLQITIGHEWFVFVDVFRAELCGNGNERPMLRLLDLLGHLHKEKANGFTCGLPVGAGARQRVYWVKPSILGEGEA